MSPRGRPALEGLFLRKRSAGEKILVPYLTAGLPTPQRFIDLASDLAASADALEIGLPFSDPIMDGPIIQEASRRALEEGATPQGAVALAGQTVGMTGLPVIVMTYFNPIHRAGAKPFIERLSKSGVSGLIVPDLPFEESEALRKLLAASGIASIQMIGPTTPEPRARKIAAASSGFVYAVSRLGVTGEQEALDEVAGPLVSRIRSGTDLPVLLGIGISGPEQAAAAAKIADGVIVGSALMKKVLSEDMPGAVSLVKQLREALTG